MDALLLDILAYAIERKAELQLSGCQKLLIVQEILWVGVE